MSRCRGRTAFAAVVGLAVGITAGCSSGLPDICGGDLGQGDQEVPTSVVCVATARGEEHYYTDVDMAGLDLDGLILDRVSP